MSDFFPWSIFILPYRFLCLMERIKTPKTQKPLQILWFNVMEAGRKREERGRSSSTGRSLGLDRSFQLTFLFIIKFLSAKSKKAVRGFWLDSLQTVILWEKDQSKIPTFYCLYFLYFTVSHQPSCSHEPSFHWHSRGLLQISSLGN